MSRILDDAESEKCGRPERITHWTELTEEERNAFPKLPEESVIRYMAPAQYSVVVETTSSFSKFIFKRVGN